VLHGPVGVGKTHLLEGIYVSLRRRHPDERVLWLTAEDFTNRFVQAMRHGKLAGFRKQFREADALLVDDVHFLAKKLATQEEFLHTFDALQQAERPVVLTCDSHPRLAEQFMPELTDRLLGGAVWSINLPEKETRLALLKSKRLLSRAEPLPEAVLDFLAEKLRGNVRELEGALHTLDHFAAVTARPITVELAREALAEVLRHCVRVVQLEDVERSVCHTLGLDKGALRDGQRGWTVSHPRMLAVYLARKHTAATYTEIGQYLGRRCHSTAVAAEKKVRDWLQADTTLNLGQQRLRVRDVLEKIERELLR
jgi:chromosomal replication initiator protein